MPQAEKLQISRLAAALFLTVLLSAPLLAQEWIDVTSEEAASHLVKKVAPVYPSFAKAAGIEGVVRIRVGIYQDGRIHSIEFKGGPPSLYKAATDAVLQYIYKPFEKDGHPALAQSTVDVVFKLGDGNNVPHSWQVPSITLGSISWFEYSVSAADTSADVGKWLATELHKRVGKDCLDSGSSSATGALEDKTEELLKGTIIIEIPITKPASHLYLVSPRTSCMCGATGNCPIEIVEENASGVHNIVEEMGNRFPLSGNGFYLNSHPGSPYPDIFITSHMSAFETDVAGYSNVGGEWGQLYCGEILRDRDNGSRENDNIRVCH